LKPQLEALAPCLQKCTLLNSSHLFPVISIALPITVPVLFIPVAASLLVNEQSSPSSAQK
jgi:hypothetical protein